MMLIPIIKKTLRRAKENSSSPYTQTNTRVEISLVISKTVFQTALLMDKGQKSTKKAEATTSAGIVSAPYPIPGRRMP